MSQVFAATWADLLGPLLPLTKFPTEIAARDQSWLQLLDIFSAIQILTGVFTSATDSSWTIALYRRSSLHAYLLTNIRTAPTIDQTREVLSHGPARQQATRHWVCVNDYECASECMGNMSMGFCEEIIRGFHDDLSVDGVRIDPDQGCLFYRHFGQSIYISNY